MTSAELIVKQYLDRGYSLESLRLLAESREQPLGAAMLAVLDRIEGEAEMVACEEDSGPCETAAYPVSEGGEEGVFFVADDEAEVSEMDGIDFDVMADTAGEAPASLEESVAEVLVGGDDEEAARDTSEAEALAAGLTDNEKQGLWSKLWTRVASASTAEAQYGPYAPQADDAPAEEPAAAEISASEALCEAIMEESVAEVEPEMSFEPAEASEVVVNEEQQEEPIFADVGAPVAMESEEAAAEPPAAEEMGDAVEAAAQSEISSDYIPGSVSELYDVAEEFSRGRIEEQKRRLLEAQEALQESVEEPVAVAEEEEEAAGEDEVMLSFESDVVAEEDTAPLAESEPEAEAMPETEAAAEEPAAEQVESLEPAAAVQEEVAEETAPEPEAVADEPAATEETVATAMEKPEDAAALASAPAAPSLSEAKRSARRERRRERARKRKEKRDAIKAAADLPEIVLTSSEGTETLSIQDEMESGETETTPMLPALAAEVADEPAASAEEAAPPMGEAMGLITPMDVFEDDSQIIIEPAAAVREEEEVAENPLAALIALSVDQDEAAAEEEDAFYAGGDDHLMILANGGSELGSVEDAAPEAAEERNVILFSQMFPVFAGVTDDEEEEEEASLPAENYLRMLPPVEAEEPEEAAEAVLEAGPVAEMEALAAVAEAAPKAPVQLDDYLTEATRLGLLRMFYGAPEPEDAAGDETLEEAGSHSLVVSIDPEPTVDELLAKEAAIRSEMEQEYQTRLDGFACRLLDVQAASAVLENALREKQADLAARDSALEEVKNRLDDMEKREKELLARIEAADAAGREKDKELGHFQGMREEHQRLYNEFEDLRKAYNEVVSDVMPGLQQERDDLAFTVERQCSEEKELRSSLGSTRRRLAVGYSLGAAAAAMLVALPVMNWFKSSGHEKELALEHQKVSELRENLQREVRQNIDGKNKITELENKVKMARTQINQLQNKNQELVRVQQDAAKNAQGGLAVFKPTESGAVGTPTRSSTMALQGTPAAGGRLHVNEVRDPAGSIEQVVADNRARNTGDAQMAAIPLNSVARSDSRNGNARSDALRPGSAQPAKAEQKKTPAKATAAPVAREGEVLATVKSGEGVAQVVYRQLGTWDPDVVRWVIQENKIKTDKRGNPVIHPNQVLRLPKDGRAGQAASAARR